MPVVVEGVPELKKALKKFAPDLLKEMNAEIRVALKEVTDDAKAKVPGQAPGNLYSWNDNGVEAKSRTSRERGFPKYNGRVIRRGLTYSIGRSRRNRQGFASLYSLLNKSAVGAIVETSGRVHPYGRPQAGNRHNKSTKDYGSSNNPAAGRIFVGAMNDVGPLKQYDKFERGRGRLLYAAYAENNGKALDATFRAIDKASRLFKQRSTVRKAA
jgi:hypothetical protein